MVLKETQKHDLKVGCMLSFRSCLQSLFTELSLIHLSMQLKFNLEMRQLVVKANMLK